MLGHTNTEMLFKVYSRYVPNLTRQDGSAMERLLASKMSQGPLIEISQPQMEYMLRLVFDWGGDEEEQTEYVQWLKRAIGMAMAAVGMSGTDKGSAHKHNN